MQFIEQKIVRKFTNLWCCIQNSLWCKASLHIIFYKINRSIKKYERTSYLALFYSDEKCECSFDRIRYLIMLKRNISDVYSQYIKIKE